MRSLLFVILLVVGIVDCNRWPAAYKGRNGKYDTSAYEPKEESKVTSPHTVSIEAKVKSQVTRKAESHETEFETIKSIDDVEFEMAPLSPDNGTISTSQ